MALNNSVFFDTNANDFIRWNQLYDNVVIHNPRKIHLDLSKYSPPKSDSVIISNFDDGKKVENLEKAIQFLQIHHSEVLSSLHVEIDNLKKLNRELLLKYAILQDSYENNTNASLSSDVSLDLHGCKELQRGPDSFISTSNKKCQTPIDRNDVSTKKRLRYLNEEVQKLNMLLTEEKIKFHTAMSEINKHGDKKRRQPYSGEGLSGRTNSYVDDKIHARRSLTLTDSLPAISQNQFISNNNRSKDDIDSQEQTFKENAHDAKLKVAEELSLSQSENCRNLLLTDRSMESNDPIHRKTVSRKISPMLQMSKVNLDFFKQSSISLCDAKSEQDVIRKLKSRRKKSLHKDDSQLQRVSGCNKKLNASFIFKK